MSIEMSSSATLFLVPVVRNRTRDQGTMDCLCATGAATVLVCRLGAPLPRRMPCGTRTRCAPLGAAVVPVCMHGAHLARRPGAAGQGDGAQGSAVGCPMPGNHCRPARAAGRHTPRAAVALRKRRGGAGVLDSAGSTALGGRPAWQLTPPRVPFRAADGCATQDSIIITSFFYGDPGPLRHRRGA